MNDRFGARADKPFTDRMYNLLVMELETSDLVLVAEHFPESTIVISALTPTGPLDEGYSQHHLEQFLRAAREIREAVPGQKLAFAVRGDLAAMPGADFVESLTAVENSFVAAWWSTDPRPTVTEIEALRAGGVTSFDLGEDAEGRRSSSQPPSSPIREPSSHAEIRSPDGAERARRRQGPAAR